MAAHAQSNAAPDGLAAAASELPILATRAPRATIDLGFPPVPSDEAFSATCRLRARSDDVRAACLRLVATWQAREEDAEAKEVAPLLQEASEIIGADPGWRTDPSRLSRYKALMAARNRASQRRIDREAALVRELAAAVGDSLDQAEWQHLRASLEASRAQKISSSMPGAQVNLFTLPAVKPLLEDPRFEEARREYLAQLWPLWRSKRESWERMLGLVVEPGHAYARGPRLGGARQAWAEAALAVQAANEWWAPHLGSLLGGTQGRRLSLSLCAELCPGVDVGWDCSLQTAFEAAAQSGDPCTAEALVADWFSRCEQVRQLEWKVERESRFRMLAGQPAVPSSSEALRDAVLQQLLEEAAVHVAWLAAAGCDLEGDPSVVALRELPERNRRRAAAMQQLYADIRAGRPGRALPDGEPEPGE